MSAPATKQAAFEAVANARGRFATEAYAFVCEALEFVQRRLAEKGRPRHVSPQELLEGVRDFGRKRFGYLGRTVFEMWGLKVSADFGDVVFDLVDAGVLAKQDEDRKEDFLGGFDFAAAFETEFVHEE
jgi:uncharacterized repeat protein (TIGR04138 family)